MKILTILAAVAVLACGCRKETTTPQENNLPVAAVRTQTVENKSRTATEEVVGTVRAKLRSVIEAKVSGKIDRMLVVPGQHVQAGELLAELDAREVQARLDQALAVREQAAGDLKRFTTLMEQKILTPAEFENAQAKFRVADAAAKEAETMLGYTKVNAPFAGVITRKYADMGDLASPGKPLLEMEDPHVLRLEADVAEAVISHLSLGDKLRVHLSSMSNELEAVVSEIAPAADSSSRTFLVKCDLPSVAGLRAGQFGRADMPVGETSALRVAASAIVQRGQMELIFIVVNARAQMRIVKTGRRIGDEVELVSGVETGEKLVTEGAAGLMDGQRVEVK